MKVAMRKPWSASILASDLARRAALALFLAFFGAPVWSARTEKIVTAIQPGPTVMSEEEKAIVSDPAKGMEHGVILVEETEQDRQAGVLGRTSFHRRAKVLSNEGRGVADVEIFVYEKEGFIERWWGRTLLPDGTMLETTQGELAVESVVKEGFKHEWRVFKGLLRGVVPGAVIDYGYSVRDQNEFWSMRFPIARSWPVRRVRIRWVPAEPVFFGVTVINTCTLRKAEKLAKGALDHSGKNPAFVIEGTDIPAFEAEPASPPLEDIQPAAICYYSLTLPEKGNYWNALGKIEESYIGGLMKDQRPLKDAIDRMRIPKDADLDAKLRAAYDWIGANIKNVDQRTAEEEEGAKSPKQYRARPVAKILEKGEGDSFEINYLFLAVARLLGAQASAVLASDRREREWDPRTFSFDQFDAALVAFRIPEDEEEKIVLLDPGGGLPYGQVRWWLAGHPAMIVGEGGMRIHLVPEPPPEEGTSETRVQIDPSGNEGTWLMSWSRTSSGQSGLEERETLRQSGETDRERLLRGMCGEGSYEVLESQAPTLTEPRAPLRLDCRAQRSIEDASAYAGAFDRGFDGPWFENLPNLTRGRRVHNVVLGHPRTEHTVIELKGPPDHRPASAPPAVHLQGPFGSYDLEVTAASTGFHVERRLVIARAVVSIGAYEGLRVFLSAVQQADKTTLHFDPTNATNAGAKP